MIKWKKNGIIETDIDRNCCSPKGRGTLTVKRLLKSRDIRSVGPGRVSIGLDTGAALYIRLLRETGVGETRVRRLENILNLLVAKHRGKPSGIIRANVECPRAPI